MRGIRFEMVTVDEILDDLTGEVIGACGRSQAGWSVTRLSDGAGVHVADLRSVLGEGGTVVANSLIKALEKAKLLDATQEEALELAKKGVKSSE